ncbi:MAG TPA: DUF6789 family protein [Chloroflexota bacterium]|jgi:hypothetical protein
MGTDSIEEGRIGFEAERAIYGGFLGIALLTVWIRAAWLLGFPPLESTSMLGSMLIGNLLHRDPNAQFILGMIFQLILGTALGLLYGEFYARIPGGHEPWVHGVLFALVLWVIGQVITAPLLGALAGENVGIFSLGLGPLALIGGLIGHLLYGVILGTIYGHHVMPRRARSATA